MAQNKYALARYCLIDSLLHKHEYVKTRYIVEVCRERLKCNITQRTIQSDIYTMQNDSFIGYYAPIEYCKNKKAYYYKDKSYKLSQFHFSEEELFVIITVSDLCKSLISSKYLAILNGMIFKIKTNIH